jgi:hypothetical protein
MVRGTPPVPFRDLTPDALNHATPKMDGDEARDPVVTTHEVSKPRFSRMLFSKTWPDESSVGNYTKKRSPDLPSVSPSG